MHDIRILIAEDDRILLKMISLYLSNKKYNIETVENGKVAIDKITNNHYDIVLTDIYMPVKTGVELINYIYKNKKNILVIVMSAFGKLNEVVELFKYEIFDYLIKPLNLEFLEFVIERAVDKITDRKKISKHITELETLNNYYKEAISFVSHELLNPLSVALSYTSIFNESNISVLEENQKNAIVSIKNNLNKMNNLISKYLDVSKIESMYNIKTEKNDLLDILKTVVEKFNKTCEEKFIFVNINNKTNEKNVFVDCDGDLISIALDNIILNALKYGVSYSDIEIEIYEKEDKYGINISNSILDSYIINTDKLFVKHYSTNEKSMGIGLYTVKKIILLHKSEINAVITDDIIMFSFFLKKFGGADNGCNQ